MGSDILGRRLAREYGIRAYEQGRPMDYFLDDPDMQKLLDGEGHTEKDRLRAAFVNGWTVQAASDDRGSDLRPWRDNVNPRTIPDDVLLEEWTRRNGTKPKSSK